MGVRSVFGYSCFYIILIEIPMGPGFFHLWLHFKVSHKVRVLGGVVEPLKGGESLRNNVKFTPIVACI